MEAWLGMVKKSPYMHLSLHFDGIMVDSKRVGNEEQFVKNSAEHIQRATGISVNVRRTVRLHKTIFTLGFPESDLGAISKNLF